MYPCGICHQQGHTALYCPEATVMSSAEVYRRVNQFLRPTPMGNVVKLDPKEPTFRQIVTKQIGELLVDIDDFEGHDELPQADKDYTSYADAFASARRNCGHRDVDNVEHRRTWYCVDCRQYLTYRQMYDARGNHQWWAW